MAVSFIAGMWYAKNSHKINKPASPKKRSLNWKKIIDNQIEDRVNVSKIKE